MIEIFGIKYITEKEASQRYAYSESWFRLQRKHKLCPKYTRIGVKKRGRVYYPLDATDHWFKMQLEMNS